MKLFIWKTHDRSRKTQDRLTESTYKKLRKKVIRWMLQNNEKVKAVYI